MYFELPEKHTDLQKTSEVFQSDPLTPKNPLAGIIFFKSYDIPEHGDIMKNDKK